MVYFLFGQMLNLLWQICDIIGQFLNEANHLVPLVASPILQLHESQIFQL